jgi:hypothetical protein
MKHILLLFFFLTASFPGLNAQSIKTENHYPHKDSAERPLFRAAILIGHTLIPAEHAGSNFFIPSWGFDLEYWPVHSWGIGLHSDLEIETFIIVHPDYENNELERISPLVVTLDALYRPWKGLVFQFGPGIEFERDENYPLLRAGLEYEFELNHHWDICPTVFYDTRFSEYHTWSIALGIGKRF